MNSLVLFRLGKNLLIGEHKNMEGQTFHLALRYEVDNGRLRETEHAYMRVNSAFVINDDVEAPMEGVSVRTRTLQDIVHENILPFVGRGREFVLESCSLVGYKRGDSLAFLREGAHEWVLVENVLTNVELGRVMALEGVRETLVARGLVDPISEVRVDEGVTVTQAPFRAYMKIDPFRDITEIQAGTVVSASGYYQGCAVVEADGEPFWVPVEEHSLYGLRFKDAEYYQNFDSNHDILPDPMQALPSKVAHNTGEPTRREDNWNSSPDLRDVVGHLTPLPNIRLGDDTSMLGEGAGFVGTHGYEDFERLDRPLLHDLSVEPGGVEAADQEDDVERDGAAHDALTKQDRTGRDAVPRDYTGEYGDETGGVDDGTVEEQTIDALIDQIIQGADVRAVFGEQLDPDALAAARARGLEKHFPGVKLD